MSNIYYSPEDYGLRVIAEIDEPNLSYEFNMVIFWANAANEVYAAQDSGCSCPSPFEEYNSVEELTRINSIEDAKSLIGSDHRFDSADVRAALENVDSVLKSNVKVF